MVIRAKTHRRNVDQNGVIVARALLTAMRSPHGGQKVAAQQPVMVMRAKTHRNVDQNGVTVAQAFLTAMGSPDGGKKVAAHYGPYQGSRFK
jgi:hypothetical protein